MNYRWTPTNPRVYLAQNNSSAVWRMVLSMPECDHPVDLQKITEFGVECLKCGEVQENTDPGMGVER